MIIKSYPCKSKSNKTVIFSSGLGGHASFWAPQVEHFTEYFNVICYDQEGVSPDSDLLVEPYSIQDLAHQLIEILKHENLSNCHFVGHALGGFIGIEVAQKAPKLIDKLVILNGWDSLDPHTYKCFKMRQNLLQDSGIEAFVRAQAIFLYPPIWISENIDRLSQHEDDAISNFPPISNVLIRLNALRAYNPKANANIIKNETLVLSNLDDILVPWQRGLALSNIMQNSKFELMLTGGHGSSVTDAFNINEKIINFLNSI